MIETLGEAAIQMQRIRNLTSRFYSLYKQADPWSSLASIIWSLVFIPVQSRKTADFDHRWNKAMEAEYPFLDEGPKFEIFFRLVN